MALSYRTLNGYAAPTKSKSFQKTELYKLVEILQNRAQDVIEIFSDPLIRHSVLVSHAYYQNSSKYYIIKSIVHRQAAKLEP